MRNPEWSTATRHPGVAPNSVRHPGLRRAPSRRSARLHPGLYSFGIKPRVERGTSATRGGRFPERSVRPEQAYQELLEQTREAALLASCIALLDWDEETYMPHSGVEHRSRQLALL